MRTGEVKLGNRVVTGYRDFIKSYGAQSIKPSLNHDSESD